MPAEPTVFVVDDDEAMRSSLSWLLGSVGLTAETYATADEFFAAFDPNRPGCLVLDVRLPGMSGLELQELMRREGIRMPIVFITGHGDVPMASRAIKGGAVDFLEKPFSHQQLLERVNEALHLDSRYRTAAGRRRNYERLLQTLTKREREIMQFVAEGHSSKEIGEMLGISRRTVEVHRAHVLGKTGATTTADLIRMVLTQESPPERESP